MWFLQKQTTHRFQPQVAVITHRLIIFVLKNTSITANNNNLIIPWCGKRLRIPIGISNQKSKKFCHLRQSANLIQFCHLVIRRKLNTIRTFIKYFPFFYRYLLSSTPRGPSAVFPIYIMYIAKNIFIKLQPSYLDEYDRTI